MYNKTKMILILTIFCNIFLVTHVSIAADFIKLNGTIRDVESGFPISDALIEIIGTPYNTHTNKDGYFQIIFESKDEYKLKITKDDFEQYEKILNKKTSNNLDVRLIKKLPVIAIRILDVIENKFIKGEVVGIKSSDFDKYKVLIYVRTNKWYIHPWASPVEGKGFAKIKSNGKWKIGTIRREHSAYEVAALLVKDDYMPYSPLSRTEFNGIPYVAICKRPGEGKL